MWQAPPSCIRAESCWLTFILAAMFIQRRHRCKRRRRMMNILTIIERCWVMLICVSIKKYRQQTRRLAQHNSRRNADKTGRHAAAIAAHACCCELVCSGRDKVPRHTADADKWLLLHLFPLPFPFRKRSSFTKRSISPFWLKQAFCNHIKLHTPPSTVATFDLTLLGITWEFVRDCPEMTSLWVYLIRLTPPPLPPITFRHFLADSPPPPSM